MWPPATGWLHARARVGRPAVRRYSNGSIWQNAPRRFPALARPLCSKRPQPLTDRSPAMHTGHVRACTPRELHWHQAARRVCRHLTACGAPHGPHRPRHAANRTPLAVPIARRAYAAKVGTHAAYACSSTQALTRMCAVATLAVLWYVQTICKHERCSAVAHCYVLQGTLCHTEQVALSSLCRPQYSMQRQWGRSALGAHLQMRRAAMLPHHLDPYSPISSCHFARPLLWRHALTSGVAEARAAFWTIGCALQTAAAIQVIARACCDLAIASQRICRVRIRLQHQSGPGLLAGKYVPATCSTLAAAQHVCAATGASTCLPSQLRLSLLKLPDHALSWHIPGRKAVEQQ